MGGEGTNGVFNLFKAHPNKQTSTSPELGKKLSVPVKERAVVKLMVGSHSGSAAGQLWCCTE